MSRLVSELAHRVGVLARGPEGRWPPPSYLVTLAHEGTGLAHLAALTSRIRSGQAAETMSLRSGAAGLSQ